jgi:hypothetical protein
MADQPASTTGNPAGDVALRLIMIALAPGLQGLLRYVEENPNKVKDLAHRLVDIGVDRLLDWLDATYPVQ